MRCKNCGSQNEEGRYICSNCGSPLYDENDNPIEDGNEPEEDDDNPSANKKSIAIIAVLCVILAALIVGIAVSAASGKRDKETSEPSSISTELKTEKTTKKQTTTRKETTSKESTSKETEATSKETTTESTTAAPVLYKVLVDIDGNGTVTGDGTFEADTRITLIAKADEGFQFDGWYNEAGALVASGSKYSFTITGNTNLTAKFTMLEVVSE